MDSDILILLLQDAIANGAIYVLMALGIVLVFNVTRIAFVSFGDLIAYSALTLASLQIQRLPGTVWLVVTLVVLAILMEAGKLVRERKYAKLPRAIVYYAVVPLVPVAIAFLLKGQKLPMAAQIALTFALILPIGPLLYRVVFRPLASASILVLLMVAVALHFAISGLALLFFGPEGFRTEPYITGQVSVAGIDTPAQTILIAVCSIAFALGLFAFFRWTVIGKALRATAINRVGARLVGIRTTQAGALAFLLAAAIATISGILIGPVTTIYYDSGFLVGLKGFVGSVVGGFVSYPLAALGALLIGGLESFASFYSSAFKEVIVFTAIIPVVIVRWIYARRPEEEEEEEEA